MAEDRFNRRYRRTSVSLRAHQVVGVQRIADDDEHGNFSRVIQDLVDDELRRRYGRDWQSVVAGEPRPEAVRAA